MALPRRLIISRSDAIGDVVLTLPLCGWLRQQRDLHITFLGRNYVRDVISFCHHIDDFLSWDDLQLLAPAKRLERLRSVAAEAIIHVFPRRAIAVLAKSAGIPLRIGSGHRLYHWQTCNRRVFFSRRNSPLHESQLNFKLLKPLIGTVQPEPEQIPGLYGLTVPAKEIEQAKSEHTPVSKPLLILHPTSQGSAREWPLEAYRQLIDIVQDDYAVAITGSKADAALLADWLSKLPATVINLAGKLHLRELIAVIAGATALVAASTGPLHLAAALGIRAVGIYAPMRPIDPGRWGPLGHNADYMVAAKHCRACRKKKQCACIESITPAAVAAKLTR
jgi:heptosyltransferase-3